MMNKFKVLLTVAFLVYGAGCAEFKQDPLEAYPENIRNGVPPSDIQTKPDRSPLSADSYRIDVDSILEFSEDQEMTAIIGARVFVDVKSFKLSIENEDVFPGSTLEEIIPDEPVLTEKKYKFTWKPPVGFTGANVMTLTPLIIKLSAERKTLTSVTKDIRVLVNRNFKVPKIVSAAFDNSEVKEGEATRLTVVFEDMDSNTTQLPRLQLETATGTSEAGVYLTFRSVNQDINSKRWTIVYDFNTGESDITENQKRTGVTFVVISRYGVRSSSMYREIWINNDLKEAVSSLSVGSTYTFVKGVRNAMSFTLVDPSKDGEVSAKLKTATASLPGTISLTCDRTSGFKWMANCEFSWNILADATTGTTPYVFDVDITNTGKSGLMPVVKPSVTKFSINVVAPAATPRPLEPVNDGGAH